MKSAYAFYRYNLSCQQHLCCLDYCLVAVLLNCFAGTIAQGYFRSAYRTRHRLGVETSVIYIPVLSSALITHLEDRHCGIRSVVGYSFDYRITRTAVGAVNEWIPVSEIILVLHLTEAILAHGNIGRYLCKSCTCCVAFFYGKLCIAGYRFYIFDVYGFYISKNGQISASF